jgi:hypothetical protein
MYTHPLHKLVSSTVRLGALRGSLLLALIPFAVACNNNEDSGSGDDSGDSDVDVEPLAVLLTQPADGDTLVHTDWSISAFFSDEMKPHSLNTDTFYLQQDGVNVPGIVQYANTQAVFLTVYPMDPGLTYTATITKAVESMSGEHLASNFAWSFTTFPCDDKDGDDVCDSLDVETCDGFDNDGDGYVDEGFDVNNNHVADCLEPEFCDGTDNDGDGLIDEGLDSDADGIANCFDHEDCDGVDNDGDGLVDENWWPSDSDRVAVCVVDEVCDGSDNDGDGLIDEGFDSDDDGLADCFDHEDCADGEDNDGDHLVDESGDSDHDGISDCDDHEVCDGLDNDGDGLVDEFLSCP